MVIFLVWRSYRQGLKLKSIISKEVDINTFQIIVPTFNFSFHSQDEIANEALKCLYGTSRPIEIDDVVNNVCKKETTTVNLDGDSSKSDRGKAQEVFKVPKFNEMVNYVWDQMQKRKKGSNAKHRFVVSNHVLQFHPLTYQEVSFNSETSRTTRFQSRKSRSGRNIRIKITHVTPKDSMCPNSYQILSKLVQ